MSLFIQLEPRAPLGGAEEEQLASSTRMRGLVMMIYTQYNQRPSHGFPHLHKASTENTASLIPYSNFSEQIQKANRDREKIHNASWTDSQLSNPSQY
jgi:hypothetical protein